MAKLVTVLGNRPQFIKAAIVGRRWREHWPGGELTEYLVHTGQHYDPMLSDMFFEQLGIAAPDVNLKVGSGPVLDQIGVMLPMLRQVFEAQKPDGVLVYGDTNSTVAAALAAAHLHIPLIHVEAGERNFRRRLAPEEVNRVVTDELAWLCLTSTEKASEYLLREGYAAERVVRVGDPMYDLYCWARALIDQHATVTPRSLGLHDGAYALATIHRNENTASKERLIEVLTALDNASLPVVLPVHPRVRNLLNGLAWAPSKALKLIDPIGYFDILALLRGCAVCATDSGGLAREAFFSGKPSVVPLPNSGWNEIVEAGWMAVVPGDGERLTHGVDSFRPTAPLPQGLFGDGFAAVRMGEVILETLAAKGEEGAWHPLSAFDAIPQPVDRSGQGYGRLREVIEARHAGGGRFLPVSELVGGAETGVALVHRVEWSLEDAVRLAEFEADLGVRATYLIVIEGEAFNPWSADGRTALTRIAALGHEIGMLVGDPGPYLDLLKSVTGKGPAPSGNQYQPITLDEAAAYERTGVVQIYPSEWDPIPMSPFEKGQRIVGRVLARLRADPALTEWMRR